MDLEAGDWIAEPSKTLSVTKANIRANLYVNDSIIESVQLSEGKSVEQKIGELEAGAGNEVITEEEINGLF